MVDGFYIDMEMYSADKPNTIDALLQLAESLGLDDAILSGAPKQNEPLEKNVGFIKSTIIAAMEHPIRINHGVDNCRYEWDYKGNMVYATCPNCTYKVDVLSNRVILPENN